MGIRGELFSTRFICEGRTYFFNVKENRNGDIFLSIVESKPTETETFDRRSIVIFQENMEGFMRAMRTAAGYMEKASQRPKPDRTAIQSSQPRQDPRQARQRLQESSSQAPRRFVIRKKPHSSGDSRESKSGASD